MDSQFRLYIGESALKRVVGVRQTELWPIVESPQKWHVPFNAQVCASQPPVSVSLLPGGPVYAALRHELLPPLIPGVECSNETILVGAGHGL